MDHINQEQPSQPMEADMYVEPVVPARTSPLLYPATEDERQKLFDALGKASDFGAVSEEHKREMTSFEALCYLLQYAPNPRDPDLVLKNDAGEFFYNVNLGFYANPMAEVAKRFKVEESELGALGVEEHGTHVLVPANVPFTLATLPKAIDHARNTHRGRTDKYPLFENADPELPAEKPRGGVQLGPIEKRWADAHGKAQKERDSRQSNRTI